MKRGNTWLLLLLAAVIAGGMLLCRSIFNPDEKAGEKSISVTVTHGDGSKKDFALQTDAGTLADALTEASLVSGAEDIYGLFIETADGETADAAKEEWWCILQEGEMLPTGASDTYITDGDAYEIALKVGYDF